MIRSMTAFAGRRGAQGDVAWDWDLRAVNGRGLDLRLRVPDGVEGLEPAARGALSARLARGSVTLSLRLDRATGAGAPSLDEAELARALAALRLVEERARAAGVALAPSTAADVLGQRGVVAAAPPDSDEGLLAALVADLDALLDDFVAARAAEGAALAAVLGAQVDRVAALTEEAAAAAEARRPEAEAAFRAALARVAAAAPEVDEGRLAQELALLAVKADVTEEIDRLRAHVGQARALLGEDAPVGRRLDFLTQELNREANTLLSKAGSAALSRVGLDLKAVIDQMREQVQNVE